MPIIIDQTKRILVQGITGREGRARTKLMREYGTNVVAGCTPGKGGQTVEGVPVFNSVSDAIAQIREVDISVVFVPARLVKGAAIEAIEAGIKLLVRRVQRSQPGWHAMRRHSSTMPCSRYSRLRASSRPPQASTERANAGGDFQESPPRSGGDSHRSLRATSLRGSQPKTPRRGVCA